MMQEACATIKRKTSSIDTLLDGYTPQEPEERRKIQAATPRVNYQTLLDKLKTFLDNPKQFNNDFPMVKSGWIRKVLLPEQIDRFLQLTATHESHPNYIKHAALIVNELIRISYEAGNNGFMLDLRNLPPLRGAGKHLYGKKENMLQISIDGSAGENCCSGSRFVEAHILAAGDFCSSFTEYSTLTIQNAGKNCAFSSKNTEYTIAEAGDSIGHRTEHCTFKTDRAETRKLLIKEIPNTRLEELPYIDQTEAGTHISKPSGNMIIHIHSDGTEETVRHYK